jgi:hypothetical protein
VFSRLGYAGGGTWCRGNLDIPGVGSVIYDVYASVRCKIVIKCEAYREFLSSGFNFIVRPTTQNKIKPYHFIRSSTIFLFRYIALSSYIAL